MIPLPMLVRVIRYVKNLFQQILKYDKTMRM
jgi:hypothetical protein